MSDKTTKKRRVDSHQEGGDSTAASLAVDNDEGGGTTMAAMLAEMKNHMTRVQNEMDDNDMRGRTASMQRQMDIMKSKCKKMGELESKCQTQEDKRKQLEARCGRLERSQ